MIVVDNLQKSFGDAHILKGISTSFDKGKTNLIIGQSGSGKTVFLKCLLVGFRGKSPKELCAGLSTRIRWAMYFSSCSKELMIDFRRLKS